MRFGTAGLRGPLGDGPDCMNVATVTAATAAVARWLSAHGHHGATVVVGRDARHGSAEFFTATTEILTAAGFDVVALPQPAPTPLLAFATRALDAVAGIQITASHNPATDNGYKLYTRGGRQIVAPDDAEIESLMTDVVAADVARQSSSTDARAARMSAAYLDRIVERFGSATGALPRIALTAMHGVGGELALQALHAAGFTDVTVVAEQFGPDPDFPTVAYPNPEEPGAADLLLALAESIDADIALALDPDADRVALGVPTADGWRMLTGDDTGALLCDDILSSPSQLPSPSGRVTVASSIVSGTLAADIAVARGASSARTLTGFKWLARADEPTPDVPLRYAYEEAIGHCVDPDAVRDKDGISATVALARIAHRAKASGQSVVDLLTALHAEHGVHVTAAASVRLAPDDFAAFMTALRRNPPTELGGIAVTPTDYTARTDGLRTDAIELAGATAHFAVRVVVRPSGTEPKVKYYTEVVTPPTYGDNETLRNAVGRAQQTAQAVLAALTEGRLR